MALGDDIVYQERRLGGVEDGVIGASDGVLGIAFAYQQMDLDRLQSDTIRRRQRAGRPASLAEHLIPVHSTVTASRSTAR